MYHVENQDKAELARVFEVMERRLYHAIMWPAMLMTTFFGVILISLNPEVLRAPWFHAKIFLVLLLFSYHFFSGHVRKRFLAGDFFLSSKTCRIINEVPTILLIGIVFLVVCKIF